MFSDQVSGLQSKQDQAIGMVSPSSTRVSIDDVRTLYHSPLLELVYRAATVHRQHSDPKFVQQCTLLSIKTGGCAEDCTYCPQSARYQTPVENQPLMSVDEVVSAARVAARNGSTRFCMGAAWREIKDGANFDAVLEMVRRVSALELEVCCTLGMLTSDQAARLKEAGLTAYNHNLDTGPNYYGQIISTRTYEDRLQTLRNVQSAGISVCCGGIIGLGESTDDRIELLHVLANLQKPPESVPINALVPVAGTPLALQEQVPVWDVIRMVAAARILMPEARVRLSAGRISMSVAEQGLCFLAGANSIFAGEKLLTTENCDIESDRSMLELFGLNSDSTV
jgi:biotin synthase